MEPAGFTDETGLAVTTLTEALEAQGLAPEDVDTVINTHLHDDHCGNNLLFPMPSTTSRKLNTSSATTRIPWTTATTPTSSKA